MSKMFSLAVFAAFLGLAAAECPNACSAHGKCGPFDMCICFKNWMEADCSQRVCQFGLAHVDTPKGDLDASSGKLQMNKLTSGTDPDLVAANSFLYPYGTTEQFPNMADSRFNILDNTAHYYSECSNKGICDRGAGTCSCFPGYEGSACQRASCPTSNTGVCSGHGTCETISTLADNDFNNIYKLWDEQATLGCLCDGGYTGSDCSEKICKYGADPLYFDDYANIRYANFTYEIYTTSQAARVQGNYSILFTDHYGESWETRPIPINANCDQVTDALESLPNRAIPSNSVLCYQFTSFDEDVPGYPYLNTGASYYVVYTENSKSGFNPEEGGNPINSQTAAYSQGVAFGYSAPDVSSTLNDGGLSKYTLVFSGNPGYIPQFSLNFYLDGYRPTLYTTNSDSSTLGYNVYVNGFSGEDDDLVPDICEGVKVSITPGTSTAYDTLVIAGSNVVQDTKAFKRCLGDSDGTTANNVDTYNWDYGNQVPEYPSDYGYTNNTLQNPHLIKLIDATGDVNDVNSADQVDPALQPIPITRVCSSQSDFLTYIGWTSNEYVGDYVNGWCFNKNPPGFYAVIFYDGTKFNIITNPGGPRAADPSGAINYYSSSTTFHVFTTTGYLQKVSPIAYALPDSLYSNTLNVGYEVALSGYVADISCENNPVTTDGSTSNYARECLNKEDKVVLLHVPGSTYSGDSSSLSAGYSNWNPAYPNIYTVKKIYRDEHESNGATSGTNLQTEEFARHKITLDYGTNLPTAAALTTADSYSIYKFVPPSSDSIYNYVAQCSNRGICDTTTGLCTCFAGYTGDDCSKQNALAL